VWDSLTWFESSGGSVSEPVLGSDGFLVWVVHVFRLLVERGDRRAVEVALGRRLARQGAVRPEVVVEELLLFDPQR